MSKKQLYLLLGGLSLVGFLWLLYCSLTGGHGIWKGCLSRQFLHIPCPSCGVTHSVKAIIMGHFHEAFLFNPLGYVVTAIMLILPPWLLVDLCRRGDSLYRAYVQAEKLLRRPPIAISLSVLIILNWIWNLTKYA